ncbi:MAG: hypothetical protein KJ941_07645, partial [Bacteroidetes bacterium]|nr:hypothetical protein [Bacteroidota bacterium]
MKKPYSIGMKNLFLVLSILIVVLGCSSGPKKLDEFLIDVSEFTISNDLLKDGDYVEILGASGNLSSEHKMDFYNLIVVRSLESGDTINILCTNYFQINPNNPKTRFISNTTKMGKLIENASTANTGDDLDNLEPKKFDKVFYDTDYIQLDIRKYKS